jgi:hypothetical protein
LTVSAANEAAAASPGVSGWAGGALGRFLAAGLEVPGTAVEERVTMAGI